MPGQLYYAHLTYPFDYPRILYPEYYDPKNEQTSRFKIKRYSSGDEKHCPIKALNLASDEFLYVMRGKIRLMVVLATGPVNWHQDDKNTSVLAAPVFSFKQRHSQEIVIRTQAFDIPSWFYLPPANDGCPKESAIRFEFIQPVRRGCIVRPLLGILSNSPVIISVKAMNLMHIHLMRFLGIGEFSSVCAKITEDIKAYHDLLLEQFLTQK